MHVNNYCKNYVVFDADSFICNKTAYLLVFLAQQTELQVNVVELPAENATGSLHSNCAALEGHLNCKETRHNLVKMKAWNGQGENSLNHISEKCVNG